MSRSSSLSSLYLVMLQYKKKVLKRAIYEIYCINFFFFSVCEGWSWMSNYFLFAVFLEKQLIPYIHVDIWAFDSVLASAISFSLCMPLLSTLYYSSLVLGAQVYNTVVYFPHFPHALALPDECFAVSCWKAVIINSTC